MKNNLITEWYKIKNYSAFIVISLFFAIGVFATNYIVFSFNKNVIDKVNTGGMVGSFSPYNFTNTWQTTSYATGWLLILPALLIIILITNEFAFKTSRQNIIDGWSRQTFIDVKLLIAFLIALASTILVVLTALGFGFASGTAFSLNHFSHVGYFFLKAMSYNLIAVFIAVLVRKTGFAIGIYFIYMGAENLLSQGLDVLSLDLRKSENINLGALGDYLPMSSSDGLLTFPDNPLKSIASSALPTNYYWAVLGFALFYLILFFWLSRRNIIKSDL